MTYKNALKEQLDKGEDYRQKYLDTMTMLAIKAPAMEAAYSIAENSDLKLYNCLIPKIRDHMKSVGIFCNNCRDKAQKEGVMAFPLNMEELEYKNKLWASMVPKLEKENAQLKAKVSQFENEF